jgi:hypothetical protein
VHDVTGSLGVPTFACSLAGRTVSYGCGVSGTLALRDGLLRLLLAYQALANDEPAYAPAAVPDLAPRLRGTATRPGPPDLGKAAPHWTYPPWSPRWPAAATTPPLSPSTTTRKYTRSCPTSRTWW